MYTFQFVNCSELFCITVHCSWFRSQKNGFLSSDKKWEKKVILPAFYLFSHWYPYEYIIVGLLLEVLAKCGHSTIFPLVCIKHNANIHLFKTHWRIYNKMTFHFPLTRSMTHLARWLLVSLTLSWNQMDFLLYRQRRLHPQFSPLQTRLKIHFQKSSDENPPKAILNVWATIHKKSLTLHSWS